MLCGVARPLVGCSPTSTGSWLCIASCTTHASPRSMQSSTTFCMVLGSHTSACRPPTAPACPVLRCPPCLAPSEPPTVHPGAGSGRNPGRPPEGTAGTCCSPSPDHRPNPRRSPDPNPNVPDSVTVSCHGGRICLCDSSQPATPKQQYKFDHNPNLHPSFHLIPNPHPKLTHHNRNCVPDCHHGLSCKHGRSCDCNDKRKHRYDC